MPDTPMARFGRAMERVDALVKLHGTVHGKTGRPPQHVSDILRGSLVLSVAALDALVLDSVAVALPRAARKGRLGDAAAKWVKGDPAGILVCFSAADPSAALGECFREQLGGMTFQRASAIEGVLRDVLGCGVPWPYAVEHMPSRKDGWTADEVRDHLDGYVSRRNRIAHSGDAVDGKKSVALIQRRYVADAVMTVRAVAQAVNRTVGDRLK